MSRSPHDATPLHSCRAPSASVILRRGCWHFTPDVQDPLKTFPGSGLRPARALGFALPVVQSHIHASGRLLNLAAKTTARFQFSFFYISQRGVVDRPAKLFLLPSSELTPAA